MIRRPSRRNAERLRAVVDCLPRETRIAMLEGLGRYDRIIVGAYSDRSGGVCPMLAAHRCGGRTDFRSFARAWDRFTGARSRARRATQREVRTLVAQIEASLWRDEDLRAKLVAQDRPDGASSPDIRPANGHERARQPRRSHWGAWLIPFRRWDGYREAVEIATSQMHAKGGRPAGAPQGEREPSTGAEPAQRETVAR